MTMLITKFNKLIANKFIWIGFTFLIVISFAFMGVTGAGDARDRQAAGTLFGESISADEFRSVYTHTYMSLVLGAGRPIPIDEELDTALTRMAWKRLVSLKKADSMGLRISDREIVAAIHSFPFFQQDGRFSAELYRNFAENYLASMGFRPGQFEEHIGQELVLQKLQRMVSAAVLVPPAEVEQRIRVFGDEFTVEYLWVDDNALDETVEVTESDVRDYFERRADQFIVPPKARVDFVRFPIEGYMDQVEVTEEQARDYYDLNSSEFEIQVEAPDTPEDEEPFLVTEIQPFDEVKEDIVKTLQRQGAARYAANEAMDFVVSLVPDRHGQSISFDEAAEKFNVSVEQADPFQRGDVPAGVDAGPTFSEAAFSLQEDPEYYFSDAVEGEKYLYVIGLQEMIKARIPEFDEVEEQVSAAAQEEAERAAVEELARSVKERAEENLRADVPFKETGELFGLEVSEPVQFTASRGVEDVPYEEQLVRTVLFYNEGEVTEPVAVNNRYLVVFVAERTAADPAEFADFRPHISASIRQERASLLFEEWQKQLLQEAEFTTRRDEEPETDG